jgi:uncharacterized Zn finger protein
MDAAIAERPDWVIAPACRSAKEIMNAGKSDRYKESIEWLKKAQLTYIQSDRHSE